MKQKNRIPYSADRFRHDHTWLMVTEKFTLKKCKLDASFWIAYIYYNSLQNCLPNNAVKTSLCMKEKYFFVHDHLSVIIDKVFFVVWERTSRVSRCGQVSSIWWFLETTYSKCESLSCQQVPVAKILFLFSFAHIKTLFHLCILKKKKRKKEKPPFTQNEEGS